MGACVYETSFSFTIIAANDCSLNGLGAGPAESIQPAVIADIFFLHDRGKWNTLYWVVYMGSLMVAPIISGAMAAHVGWRNFWWLNVALTGLSFIMVAFMFPETKWHRLHPDEIDHSSLASSNKQDVSSLEKTPVDASMEQIATASSEKPEDPLEVTDTASRDPWLGRGGPSKQQWAIYQPNVHPWKSIALDLWIPWKLFAFPIVEFASFVVSWSCSSFLTLNLTQTQAFAAPPYNFTTQSIGEYSERNPLD